MKKLSALLLAFSIVFTMVGCSGTKSTTGETSGDAAQNAATTEKIKVGLALTDLTNETLIQEYEKMKEYADANGIELLVSDCKESPPAMVDGIENFINAGCDAIVVNNFYPEAVQDVVTRATEKGIPVFCTDNVCENVTLNIVIQQYELGLAIGEMVGTWINENWPEKETVKIAVTSHSVSSNSMERVRGMEEQLLKTAPQVELLGRQDAITAGDGYEVFENFNQMHPDMDGFMCINDGSALGVIEAAAAAGKTAENFAIWGCDGSLSAYNELQKDGTTFRGTVDIGAVEMAVNLLKSIHELVLNGAYTNEPAYIITPVTQDNVVEYITGLGIEPLAK